MAKTDPSVGTDWVNAASAAPMKVIWAWNWRASGWVGAGAAETREARRARAVVMVKVFMVANWNDECGFSRMLRARMLFLMDETIVAAGSRKWVWRVYMLFVAVVQGHHVARVLYAARLLSANLLASCLRGGQFGVHVWCQPPWRPL